ncbi:MAG: hypothetical protein NTV52_17020 [Acidobacteria bacterium]|nr:hypothetical protein [Acidobacteriota bacterium]
MISDTTPEAQRVYEAAIRAVTPAERVSMCMEIIAVTDGLLRAGIRLRFPEAGAEESEYQLLRAKYGKELARQVYGRSA